MDAQREHNAIHKLQSGGKPLALGEYSCCSFFIVVLFIKNLQLSEVMSAVAYLHGLKIVHGDLKGVRLAPVIHLLLIDK